jgi:diguanylate cyclase (GGDEF)-like protein
MAKARILAVDDQRYFRELIAGMLGEEGFEAQTAASGEEALHILDNADFDVVLTDLVMPGMDGSELVHRIKQRDPDQAIVVVTGVVDVKTAVDAMKLGATDYLLKPFDRRTLAVALEGILQNRRLKAEHDRLLAENIEYIGEYSLYERALGLFSTLAIEPLAVRIIEALCLETRAQGGVLWVVGETSSDEFDLAAARGLVRLADEPETIELRELPVPLQTQGARTALALWGDDAGDSTPALYAALRRDGAVVALARLTDKLEGESFDAVDEACATKLLHFAEVALSNALRVRSLERRSLQDAATGAYSFDYFRDALRTEIEKANRFGRSLALMRIDLGPAEAARGWGGEAECRGWLTSVAEQLTRLLRATDLLAVDASHRFYVLLAEADALGAAVLKRRAVEALASSELLGGRPPEARLQPRAGIAIYPGDGTHLEALLNALEDRIAQEQQSPVSALGLDRLSLAGGLQALVRHGVPERSQTAEQLVRFALAELARHPRSRGLLYVAPGEVLAGAVRDGLDGLRGVATRTDLVVISDGPRPGFSTPAVNWVAPSRTPGLPPCLIHYGDGPSYALVREEARAGAPARLFHTSDRSLVEHLAFRLQHELAIPPSLGHEVRT